MLGKLFTFGFILLFAFAVQELLAQEETNPIKWSIKLEKPLPSQIKGETFQAELNAVIEKGWHLYALEKIEGGPIPTKISVADDSPFELGKIEAPAPIEVDDSAFGVTTKFYEDAVKFVLPLKISNDYESGKSELRIRIRFQTCNDQMCLPPKTVVVSPNSEQTQSEN